MVFILAASSLHHVLGILTTEEKSTSKEQVYSIPGLSLNTNTKHSIKIVQNLQDVEQEDKNNVVIWHDVINISFSGHESNRFRSFSIPEIMAILKQFENKIRAPVYCQGDGTPNIIEESKGQSISNLHVEKHLSHLENRKIKFL